MSYPKPTKNIITTKYMHTHWRREGHLRRGIGGEEGIGEEGGIGGEGSIGGEEGHLRGRGWGELCTCLYLERRVTNAEDQTQDQFEGKGKDPKALASHWTPYRTRKYNRVK